eukprot:gnl/MRDRNA2_/MRDRNA2_118444_c0_seq1.p1 gnl/MRDRNA2_/MRDRNA2_118444_c0~~gnl/MRDRNA2_/MRDRNA2_118444_c0_seq1.p1  ORF type:complete len:143 (-),score=21.45 gnl/MRDRNA2_/MRDRNA2_118444_c0_seq1:480-908(-)
MGNVLELCRLCDTLCNGTWHFFGIQPGAMVTILTTEEWGSSAGGPGVVGVGGRTGYDGSGNPCDDPKVAEQLGLTNFKRNARPTSSNGQYELVASVVIDETNDHFPWWAHGLRNDRNEEFIVLSKFEKVLEEVEHDEEDEES